MDETTTIIPFDSPEFGKLRVIDAGGASHGLPPQMCAARLESRKLRRAVWMMMRRGCV